VNRGDAIFALSVIINTPFKDIGASKTLVSNWWYVNSFLGPKKRI
jgi:hypothetical protein